MNEEKEFLSIKEAAAMLGVTTLTLRNWDKSGKFTASRHPINNYRMYRKAEVLMFLEDIISKGNTTKTSPSKGVGAAAKRSKKLSVTHLEE